MSLWVGDEKNMKIREIFSNWFLFTNTLEKLEMKKEEEKGHLLKGQEIIEEEMEIDIRRDYLYSVLYM